MKRRRKPVAESAQAVAEVAQEAVQEAVEVAQEAAKDPTAGMSSDEEVDYYYNRYKNLMECGAAEC